MSKDKIMTKPCSVCGSEIAKNAKTCPSCGAKNKKSIYKRWWFWAIIVIIAIGIIGSGSDSDNPEITADNLDVIEQNDDAEEVVAEQAAETTPVATASEEIGTTLPETSEETEIQETSNDTSSNITMGQKNALGKAQDYLAYTSFSRSGLIEQLKYESFSNEEATYAADNCGADWNEQAAKKAADYLDYGSFSREGLITQLEYEGFSSEQAAYGATAVGY